jgi:hypothetical protein
MVKKKNIKKTIMFILLFSFIAIIITLLLLNLCKREENQSIYCKTSSSNDSIELYFDFNNNSLYRYSIITTNQITDEFDISIINKQTQINNEKYKGLISKIWYDDNTFITYDIFDLNLLSEEEMKEITGLSIKELKSKSRDELKENIIYFASDEFFCK